MGRSIPLPSQIFVCSELWKLNSKSLSLDMWHLKPIIRRHRVWKYLRQARPPRVLCRLILLPFVLVHLILSSGRHVAIPFEPQHPRFCHSPGAELWPKRAEVVSLSLQLPPPSLAPDFWKLWIQWAQWGQKQAGIQGVVPVKIYFMKV